MGDNQPQPRQVPRTVGLTRCRSGVRVGGDCRSFGAGPEIRGAMPWDGVMEASDNVRSIGQERKRGLASGLR